jgi:hypothetical protein
MAGREKKNLGGKLVKGLKVEGVETSVRWFGLVCKNRIYIRESKKVRSHFNSFRV